MKFISPIELQSLLSENACILLDVREPYELEICQLDAVHIPMAEVFHRRDELPTDQTVVVMCRSGKRAEAVATLLIEEGKMGNIVCLEGGILNWIEQINPSLERY